MANVRASRRPRDRAPNHGTGEWPLTAPRRRPQGSLRAGSNETARTSLEGGRRLDILRVFSPDSLSYVLLAAACVAAIVLIVLFARARPAKPVEVLTPDETIQRQFAAVMARLETLERGVNQVSTALPATVQSIGFVRFNPFPEMGGTMSFSMALLDAGANGVVISVLNDRQGSRVYGKPVEAGVSAQKLSNEEQQAIGLARGRKA